MRTKELKEVILFFGVTILLSYCIFWGPIALLKIPTVNLVNGTRGPIWAILLFIVGGFVPSILGILFTRLYDGKAGVRQLVSSAFNLRIGFKWYACVISIAIYFAAALIASYAYLGGKFDYSQFLVQLPTIIPLVVLGPLSEEFGWRGFATKRLLKHLDANLTSLVTGLVWAFWHLPLFYMLGTSQHEFHMPFAAFVVSVTSISFVYTYIYMRTSNSLFSAVFFHWVYTYVLQVVSSSVTRSSLYNWLECLPALIIGLLFSHLIRSNESATYPKTVENTTR